MIAQVWSGRQDTRDGFSFADIKPTAEDHLRGVAFMPCDWCVGAGRLELHDGKRVPCNTCKTSGRIPVVA